MLLEMEKLNLFQRGLTKHILIGWKILEIGVYQDNCGGDIEYQHIIVKSVVICKFQKVKLQNVINVEAKI